MVQLIHNELRKLRRERSLWFALALHLAPWVMVAVASLMGVGGTGSSGYFILHNQSMLVTGLVACVVTSIGFHVELTNRTWFDWLIQPQGASRLVVAKLLTIGVILAFFVAISVALMVGLMVGSGVRSGLDRMVVAYLGLQCGTFVLMVAIAAAVCLLTRNVVVVNIVGVAIGMVTMVLMGAEFSWAVPTVWPYRLGLTLLDQEYAYQWPGALPAGGVLYATCTVAALVTATFWARRPRVINASLR